MAQVKYIKTEHNQIITFSDLLQHSEFKHFNPVSAGFISISSSGKYDVICKCYGDSISLKLKSDEKIDSELARKQILGYDY